MKKISMILLPLSFIFLTLSAQDGQDTTIVVGKNRILYQNRIYRQNAPYVSLAYGAGYNISKQTIEQNMSLAYHHFIKNIGIFGGYHVSSDTRIWWRSYQKLNDFYLGMGRRWESTKMNLAVFAGPSLARGSYTGIHPDTGKEWAWGFLQPGLYLEGQVTYKVLYDVGLGLSFYSSLSRYYQVAGLQLHLFFSTAYVRNYE